MSRLMDDQQSLVKDFEKLFDKFSKEGAPRRTIERRDRYDAARTTLWKDISDNHQLLMAADPPTGYKQKFVELALLNDKFCTKLKVWVSASVTSQPATPNPDAERIAQIAFDDKSRGNQSQNLDPKKEEPEASGEKSQKTQHNLLSDDESEDEKMTFSSNGLPQLDLTSASTLEKILLMMAENQARQKTGLKPPTLEIEVFNGDIKLYRTFKNMFNRAVAKTNWSQIELFTFLQSKLSGEAKDAIEGFEVTRESYALAWEVLDERFLNRRKLLESLVSTIIDPNLKVLYNNAQSASQFIKVSNSLFVNIKQLKCTAEELMVEILLAKLDKKTRGRFEDYVGFTSDTPAAQKVNQFLQKEKEDWQRFAPSTTSLSSATSTSKNGLKTFQTKAHITTDSDNKSVSKPNLVLKCFVCGKPHSVVDCDQFLSCTDREQLLKKHKVCIFCAAHAYSRSNPCRKRRNLKCEKCQGTHITLLHPLESTEANEHQNPQTTPVLLTETTRKNFAVLPTAVAKLLDNSGNECSVRCLVDLCAERSYVSENIVQQLKLKKFRTSITVSGINGISGKVTSYVHLTMKLDDQNLENITVEALVVPKISGMLPSSKLPHTFCVSERQLADPSFTEQSFVGALLGGDIAPRLFKHGIPNEVTEDGLLLQPTHLGWIVSGSTTKSTPYVSTFITMNENMEKLNQDQELMKRILDFYELPEYENTRGWESDYCEQIFQEGHYRLPDGRYVVPMPWKQDCPPLGHSYRKAIRMFKGQEGKWLKNKEHYDMSNDFMVEYEALGHMSRVDRAQESSDNNEVFYIPYLSILRKGSLTTKLRNVFNASMPTSNGISLNDTMWEGPKLQTSIKDVLMKARSFPFIYSADISKMFRQILVRPEDRDKLRIIWRPSPDERLREYRLNTVTYGTDAAPYLAIRTIHQCASDNASSEIASIIQKAFYVDDLLYGADSISEATQQIKDIRTALSSGKFPLTKWMSNDTSILTDIPESDRITSFLEDSNLEIKLLGATYNFEEDNFRLNLKEPESFVSTKRGISSASASFYDPMGFILPFIMLLRIFLQRVWKEKVDWDEKLSDVHQKEFSQCIQGVNKLNSIKIPRYIPANSDNVVEMIGFADASSHAQAAVIYSRVKTSTGYSITLVTAKGNVSKWKTAAVIESKQATIPKLELEALSTLAELFKSVKESFGHRQVKFTAYTDSQVALAWVRGKKKQENKFIERRVTKIRGIINPENLHYVKSEENPADPASRGLTANQLSSCALWFLGPAWLQQDDLPTTPYCAESKCLVASTPSEPEIDMFARYSSWIRVMRMVAYCLSWWLRKPGCIKAEDITKAKIYVLRYYQMFYLSDAIRLLQQGKTVPKAHWLHRLSPFVDTNQLLRVGGRLGNAHEISENQRHPIVIPKSHGMDLLVRHTHLMNSHAPNSLMLRLLVEDYWMPGVKAVIKGCIRKCPKCIRWNARTIQPEMAQLPKERVTPSATFEKVGVDLCGPFTIRASHLRFDKTMKVWVVNFVCLSTKAVHLEIVTSLSSEHFLAAFSRFCCRRGTSGEVWSDNGTNFVGANRQLRETWEQIVRDCEKQTAIQEITWKFIPRHSPTFGGLWEACVKSLKYFIKRMADVRNLTYEELSTLLCKIEALLNSRPLCSNPLTPQEEPALTPFHFINQRGFKPSPVDAGTKVPLTKKWLMIHRIQQDFWQRFKTEYLRELQAKVKWQKPELNLGVDDIVLIKEPNTNPGDWKMGKIVKTYPDPSGVVRKVDVVTATKSKTLHAVNRLVPLLRYADEEAVDLQHLKTTSSNNFDCINKKEVQPISKSPENSSNNPAIDPSNKTISGSDVEIDSLSERSELANNNIGNQPPRRSTRLANKLTLVHLCLLVLSVFCPTVKTLSIEELSSGAHIKHLGKTYMKVIEMEFSVKTNLNLTQDIQIIEHSTKEFRKECVSIGGSTKLLVDQCNSLQISLSKLAQQTSSDIVKGYQQRARRWISLTSKTLWKAAPAIATTFGMVYQETQIHSLQKQLSNTRAQLQRTANVLLNATDLEYEAIEGKLNEVISKQQEILLQETIISYAQKLELLYNHLKAKHESVTSITPMDQLRKFAEPLLATMTSLQIPEIGNEIFNVYQPKKKIQGDFTIVDFTIPIVSRSLLDVYLLISVPSSNGDTLMFDNNDKFQRIIVNPTTKTFADITNLVNLHPLIIDNVNMVVMNECISSLLPIPGTTDNCNHKVIQTLSDEIVPVHNDLVLVFTSNELHTSIECQGSPQQFSTSALLVNTTECSVITGNHALGLKKPAIIIEEDDLDSPTPASDMGVKAITHNPIAVELRENLKHEIENWSELLPTDTGYLIAYVLVVITGIVFTFIIMRCFCSRQQETSQ